MTGFATPPSTTDSTTPLFKCVPGQDFYHPQMEYTRACVVIRQRYNDARLELSQQKQNATLIAALKTTAAAVANDIDGYTGIQFCRWVADVAGKKENIDWDKFK